MQKIKLEDITSPEFLKSLSIKELNELSSDIRTFLIDNISKTGGHLSSNLGVVELTIALHYVFNSPYDKIIFDVGHQGYVHKILTGRAKYFDKLRKKNGLSGFLKYSESIHDVWEAGHSSTSISAASGFLEAKESGVDMGEVIAVIGDGSIQNGLSLSAINYLSSKPNQKIILIINDNNMSISKNVGGLAKMFNKIRIRKSYTFFKKITPNFIKNILSSLKKSLMTFAYKNEPLSSLGLNYKYFGPIDGNNINELIKYLKFAKETPRSVIIHVKTKKGKGYQYAENDTVGNWHGVVPFNISDGKPLNHLEDGYCTWSEGISNILLDIARENKKIKVITAATICGSYLEKFNEQLPKQLIDVGICEEHAVVMASAMSRNGLIPIISMYSTFLQRAYDELNHDVARSNAHVIFLIDRAGIVGGDGDTHQGTFDIALFNHLPNFVVTMPSNLSEAKSLLEIAVNNKYPFVIRYPKNNTLNTLSKCDLLFGKWIEIIPIKEVNIVTYGPVLSKFEEIINEEKLNVGLINALFIKPMDFEMLNKLKGKTIITYEEVVISGSLSETISIYNSKNDLNMKIKVNCLDNGFIETGTIKELKKDLNLDVRDILKNVGE